MSEMRRKLSCHSSPAESTLGEAETSLAMGTGSHAWALAVSAGLSKGHKELRTCVFRRLKLEIQAPQVPYRIQSQRHCQHHRLTNRKADPGPLPLSVTKQQAQKRQDLAEGCTTHSPTSHSSFSSTARWENHPCQKTPGPITTRCRVCGERKGCRRDFVWKLQSCPIVH